MELILSNEFISIEVDAKKQLLTAVWTKESAKIDENFFRNVNLKYVELTETYLIKSVFINTVDLNYTIKPQLQECVANQILPKLLDLGLKKIAFLMSEDFVTQLSVEQTMEERDLPFEVRYFSNEKMAKQWLD